MSSKKDWEFDKKNVVKALEELSCHILNPLNDDNVFELVQLINHCEDLEKALDKAKELSDSNNELKRTIRSLDYALSDVYNDKPYKFEDLKPNMWVFDCVKNRVNKIIVTFVYGCPYIKLDDGFGEWFIVGYEENRFFPMQMANVVLNNG